MMMINATVITGVLEFEYDEMQDVQMCICSNLTVTATTKPQFSTWMYGRPFMFKEKKWSFG